VGRLDKCWEPWQREYAFGAFYIFPPYDLAAKVDELRWAYDPNSAAICQAHVSLSEPLRSRLDSDHAAEIRERLASLEPFQVEYGPIRGFAPHPGVALTIGPERLIRSLRDTIHSTSAFKQASFKRADIPPHMTIAEFITIERSDELLDELAAAIPDGTFECSHVVHAVPDSNFHFVTMATYPIGSRP
jgi:2'-5' RNA ligase superfamily